MSRVKPVLTVFASVCGPWWLWKQWDRWEHLKLVRGRSSYDTTGVSFPGGVFVTKQADPTDRLYFDLRGNAYRWDVDWSTFNRHQFIYSVTWHHKPSEDK